MLSPLLNGPSSRSMEDSGVGCDFMNCEDQDVLEERTISMRPRDWFCVILVKNVTGFAPV